LRQSRIAAAGDAGGMQSQPTRLPSPAPLTHESHAAWERNGFLIVRNVLQPESIAGMRAAFARASDRILDELHTSGALPTRAADAPVETALCAAGALANRYGRSWRQLVVGPEVFAIHHDPGLVAILRQLIGGTTLLGSSVFNARPKLPGQRLTEVPWHQDLAYFPEGSPATFVTAWMPAVPVDAANGCMQVLAGSHRRGLSPHHQETDEAGFLSLPAPPMGPDLVTCAMQPGDVLFMHHLVWHASGPNTTAGIRWSIDCRFSNQRELEIQFPEPWVVDGPRQTDLQTWLGWWKRPA
jgi:phytanoyl-CoA hydroxylase